MIDELTKRFADRTETNDHFKDVEITRLAVDKSTTQQISELKKQLSNVTARNQNLESEVSENNQQIRMLQDMTDRKADKTQISELEEKLANFPTLGQQS